MGRDYLWYVVVSYAHGVGVRGVGLFHGQCYSVLRHSMRQGGGLTCTAFSLAKLSNIRCIVLQPSSVLAYQTPV